MQQKRSLSARLPLCPTTTPLSMCLPWDKGLWPRRGWSRVGTGDTREPLWLHGAAHAGPCVSPSLGAGQLGGAGGGWEGDGNVASAVGSPLASSPRLGPEPTARGCAYGIAKP